MLYYNQYKGDTTAALDFSKAALSLAVSDGNARRQLDALTQLAVLKWQNGDYRAAQAQAQKAQGLAKKLGNLYAEATSLRTEGMCCYSYGNYREASSLYKQARHLLYLCGMSDCQMDLMIISCQAQLHAAKSEYIEAHSLMATQIQQLSIEQNVHHHALGLLDMAVVESNLGTPKATLQQKFEQAKSIFETTGDLMSISYCDLYLAELYLPNQADSLPAQTIFRKYCQLYWATHTDLVMYCLEQLAEMKDTNWTAITENLAHLSQINGPMGMIQNPESESFPGKATTTKGGDVSVGHS
ncbi:hypothetical protein C8R43DRAFT_952684 [Mycena crocata]|nr:hypothetical protein C8R43DRAFT_952684 [Mycena crocata]